MLIANSLHNFVKQNGRILRSIRIACILLFTLSSFVFAQDYKPMRYSAKWGISSTRYPAILDKFWKDGLNVGAGIRLPFCILCDYSEFWIFGDYNRFPFRRNPRFPIDSLDGNSIVVLSGDPVRIYTVSAGVKIFIRNKRKRVLPYTYIGYGYLNRTDITIRSESPHLPYARIKHDDVSCWFWSLGIDVKIINRARVFLELGTISGETLPSLTQYNLFALGILFR